jgi:prepilin-type N-terminal cleavage/methylation domain-containing protein/prepilin-type processing-associated H-X9-DG protein
MMVMAEPNTPLRPSLSTTAHVFCPSRTGSGRGGSLSAEVLMRTFSIQACSKARRPRGGFTLVELLVVIGIIAVLMSILLPSLSQARKQAKVVQCQSSLRQLGLAAQMYATANRNTFPNGQNYWWDYPAAVRWQSGMYNFPRRAEDYTDPFPSFNKLVPDWVFGEYAFVQFLMERELPIVRANSDGREEQVHPVWRCPEMYIGNTGEVWMVDHPKHTTYRYNVFYAAGRKTTMMNKSAEAMLFYDGSWPDWRPNQYPHYPMKPDLPKMNVVYGDGHVASLTYRELIAKDWRDGVTEGDSKLYKDGWRLRD